MQKFLRSVARNAKLVAANCFGFMVLTGMFFGYGSVEFTVAMIPLLALALFATVVLMLEDIYRIQNERKAASI